MASLDEFLEFKAEVDALTGDLRKSEYATLEERHAFEQRVEEVLLKMERFWLEDAAAPVAPPPVVSEALVKGEAPEMPSEVLVKQAGDAPDCGTCGGQMPCACFAHLPDPKITVEKTGLFKIEFDDSYNAFDRLNWLSAMKLVVAKRKVRK